MINPRAEIEVSKLKDGSRDPKYAIILKGNSDILVKNHRFSPPLQQYIMPTLGVTWSKFRRCLRRQKI